MIYFSIKTRAAQLTHLFLIENEKAISAGTDADGAWKGGFKKLKDLREKFTQSRSIFTAQSLCIGQTHWIFWSSH